MTLLRTTWVLLGVCILVSAAAADDLAVPSVYPTIQAGIDAAQAGDTVVIAPGVYSGHGNRLLFVSKPG